MCLLTFHPPHVSPDLTALRTGAENNDNGHGFAIASGSEILVGHGMDAEVVLEEFARARSRSPEGPALFHSRWATHGAVNIGNCHPFRLGRDQRTVVAHNGVLPKRVRPGRFDRRSDTRIAAETYLPSQPFGSVDTPGGRRGLESWLGSSKLVLLTVNPAYAHRGYIFNERAGLWDNGVWYSNASYHSGSSRSTLRWLYVCALCRTRDYQRRDRYCRTCGWCFTCLNTSLQCLCRERRSDTSPVPQNRHRTGDSMHTS
ncbi:hypothetical protein ABIA39_004517 [Nocardia sp. GAS34]|uniref:class II glutamine amidotransferase n=1 Tax=unclassified Nocardia TaxID=2637762 RepID=UPI003D1FE016